MSEGKRIPLICNYAVQGDSTMWCQACRLPKHPAHCLTPLPAGRTSTAGPRWLRAAALRQLSWSVVREVGSSSLVVEMGCDAVLP